MMEEAVQSDVPKSSNSKNYIKLIIFITYYVLFLSNLKSNGIITLYKCNIYIHMYKFIHTL